jgi:hypothetical protein
MGVGMRSVFSVLFLLALFVLSGCVTTHNATIGTNLVSVGEVPVSKALIYIGGKIDESLIVKADENGNAVLVAGKGILEMIPLYLSPNASSEFDSRLSKLVEWGEISKNNKIETSKNLEPITLGTGFGGRMVVVAPKFRSFSDGLAWFAGFNLCQIRSSAEMTFGPSHGIQSNPCAKELDLYLTPESVVKLKALLAQVPNFSAKASSSKVKSDLLK